eukprot:352665-Chlamydomonas_euryale.AAC.5
MSNYVSMEVRAPHMRARDRCMSRSSLCPSVWMCVDVGVWMWVDVGVGVGKEGRLALTQM